MSVYNQLTPEQREMVALDLLTIRPIGGYPDIISVQVALDNAVNQMVNPMRIFVRPGGSGDGSAADPFGTIQEGIDAVSPQGEIHLLAGVYPITKQIVVNKNGIDLIGEQGTILMLQADLIQCLITAENVTIFELTMTSEIPYPKEFIQIGGNNTRIIGNTIFGPEQA